MKNHIITAVLCLLFTSGFSQDSNNYIYGAYADSVRREKEDPAYSNSVDYSIRGVYTHPVKKEKVATAKSLSDICPGYASGWIASDLVSEILVTGNSKPLKAVAFSSTLSDEQKGILSEAYVGSDIDINVKYSARNTVTDKIENRTMNYTVTVVPDAEAEFTGGSEMMTKYLKDSAIDELSKSKSYDLLQGTIRFTIDEKGNAVNARVSRTSGDSKIDKLLLEIIRKMPPWQPAKMSNGVKMKQEFEFRVGVGTDGC